MNVTEGVLSVCGSDCTIMCQGGGIKAGNASTLNNRVRNCKSCCQMGTRQSEGSSREEDAEQDQCHDQYDEQ